MPADVSSFTKYSQTEKRNERNPAMMNGSLTRSDGWSWASDASGAMSCPLLRSGPTNRCEMCVEGARRVNVGCAQGNGVVGMVDVVIVGAGAGGVATRAPGPARQLHRPFAESATGGKGVAWCVATTGMHVLAHGTTPLVYAIDTASPSDKSPTGPPRTWSTSTRAINSRFGPRCLAPVS